VVRTPCSESTSRSSPAEVHGLLGENGSGKSTLIKILNGFHTPNSGSLQIAVSPSAMPLAPGQFRELGLSFVHQDLGLIPELSVLENLRVGELIANRSSWIAWRTERQRASETFARYGLKLDPAAMVSELTQTERALLADRSRRRGHTHEAGRERNSPRTARARRADGLFAA